MIKIILFTVLVFFAMFVQTFTGFGGPLLAMPLSIILLGVDTARPVITFAAIIAAALVAVPRYKDINWKQLLLMVCVMFAGVIAGDFLIGNVKSAAPLLVIYGVIVLFIGTRRLLKEHTRALPVPLQYGAIVIAGIMQGLFISGGSFLVLYAVEQLKEKREFRATMSAVWVPLNIYLLAHYAVSGMISSETVHLSAIIFIPELVAIFLASKLTDKLDQQAFLKITYLILAVSGAVLVINSIL